MSIKGDTEVQSQANTRKNHSILIAAELLAQKTEHLTKNYSNNYCNKTNTCPEKCYITRIKRYSKAESKKVIG